MPVYSQISSQRRQRLSQTLVPERHSEASRSGGTPNYRSDVELLDVSSIDIRCVIDANPMIGDTVEFDVEHDDGHVSHVTGRVHWKQIRRNGYEVGLFLASGLPAGMLGLQTEGRRKSNRYRCRQAGCLYRPETGQQSDACVVDYSDGGVSIQTQTFCDVDEAIRFEWTGDHGRQQITGQVLWQIEQSNGVLLGCQTSPGDGYRIAGLRV